LAFLLGTEKASVEFPTKEVFRSISLGVDTGARIGIVGRNGDGKSTLLALLAGKLEPNEGRVVRTRGVQVGLLSQTDSLCDTATVQESVVGDRPEYEWASDARIRSIFSGLLSDIDWSARIGTLSGGQRRRVDLARLLAGSWDVLMLDEPTNHLDLKGITWLANHLKTRWKPEDGALLVVTHDRWFLDEVCLAMWEVHDGGVEPFEGGFSAYIMQRVERERLAELAEQKRQNKLRRELAWLSRGARARATKPKFHVAAAQALIADVPPLRNPLELKRMAMARLGKQVVDIEDATVSFDGHKVIDDLNWIIGPGDRYGIVGKNGAGKTTLLQLVEGKASLDSGRVKIGKTVRFAVLSQNLDGLKKFGDDRVRVVIGRYKRRIMLDGKEQTPAQLLERLGFSRADLSEPVSDLSGGQKRRLALMLILLDEPNVLILDEPGNDLDTDMLAAVEDLLDGWPGTLLLVTHDRYLMERTTDDQFALIDGKLRHLPGGIDEYLELEAASEKAKQTNQVSSPDHKKEASRAKDEKEDKRDMHLSGGRIRELRKRMESSERKMETLRKKIDEAKTRLAESDQTDFEALMAIQEEIDGYESSLADFEQTWLSAAEELGE
jgi:ATP-binding cassette subfamily F protein uup